jgi:uncharacterized DUF497 family protein
MVERFDWDPNKNIANISKHGISFAEATTVFNDAKALYKSDPKHSDTEDRFIIIGFSENSRLLMVCHCYKESETVIRIISARKATRTEFAEYGGLVE